MKKSKDNIELRESAEKVLLALVDYEYRLRDCIIKSHLEEEYVPATSFKRISFKTMMQNLQSKEQSAKYRHIQHEMAAYFLAKKDNFKNSPEHYWLEAERLNRYK